MRHGLATVAVVLGLRRVIEPTGVGSLMAPTRLPLKRLRLGRYRSLCDHGDLDTGVVSTAARVHQLWIRAASDNSAEI